MSIDDVANNLFDLIHSIITLTKINTIDDCSIRDHSSNIILLIHECLINNDKIVKLLYSVLLAGTTYIFK